MFLHKLIYLPIQVNKSSSITHSNEKCKHRDVVCTSVLIIPIYDIY